MTAEELRAIHKEYGYLLNVLREEIDLVRRTPRGFVVYGLRSAHALVKSRRTYVWNQIREKKREPRRND